MNTRLCSSTRTDRADDRRAFVACMLGGAIGDALGMPLERLSAACVEGSPCFQFRLKGGMYTDDTQAVRATAISIARSGRVDARVVADGLSAWFFDSLLDQPPRNPGVTTNAAMKKYCQHGDPSACGINSQTCGAAIRISPVALWLSLHPELDFVRVVREAAMVTHTGDAATDGAVIVAELVRSGINGTTPNMRDFMGLCASKKMRAALAKVEYALATKQGAADLVQELGHNTKAIEVVPLALFHLYNNDFQFTASLEKGLDTIHPSGLDMDSVLSIAGAASGVRCVVEVENSQWLGPLESAHEIAAEASSLYDSATAGNAM